MATLDSTWNYVDQLKELSMDTELRTEVDKYISLYVKPRGVGSFVGICIRASLAYIVDNIENPELLSKLKELNKEE